MYEQEMTIRNWAFKVCLMPKYLNILKQSQEERATLQCRHPEDLYAHLCLHHRKSNQCPEDSPDGNGMT